MIVAEFIKCCRTTFGIPHAIACRALGVSQSWFLRCLGPSGQRPQVGSGVLKGKVIGSR